MTIQDLGSIGELIGAIAVVISLVYLALQVRQNTQSNMILASQNLVNQNSALIERVGSNAELAALLQKGQTKGFDALTPEEELQFNCNMLAIYNQFELAFHQYRRGNLLPEIWNKFAYEIPIWISLPGGSSWYAKDKERYSPEFRKYIDDRLRTYVPPAEIPTLGRTRDKVDAADDA